MQSREMTMLLGAVAILVVIQGVAGAAGPSEDRAISEAKEFARLLCRGEFSAACDHFDPELAKAMDAGRLRAAWRQSTEPFGAFSDLISATVQSGSRHKTVIVKCEFDRSTADLEVRISPAGRVLTFYLMNVRGKPAVNKPAISPTIVQGSDDGQITRTGNVRQRNTSVGFWAMCGAVAGLVVCVSAMVYHVVGRKKGDSL